MERTEWLQERRRHVGGSDVAAILGLSRWQTAWDVFRSKTEDPEDDDDTAEEKPWLTRGRYLEPAIGNWYADTHGHPVEHHQNRIIEGPEPWMAASVDYFVHPPKNKAHGLECKSSRLLEGWGDVGTDIIPVDYALQCHWYMAVTGCDRWDVAVLFLLKDEFRSYTLRADPEVQEAIVSKCRDWWKKHIEGRLPPEPDGSNASVEWLKKRFPEPKHELRQALCDEVEMGLRLQEVCDSISKLDKEREILENKLKFAIGDAEGISWGPQSQKSTVTYKAQPQRRIDSKALKRDLPDIYTKYETVKTIRVFRRNIKE